MNYLPKAVTFLLIATVGLSQSHNTEWIDPHEMTINDPQLISRPPSFEHETNCPQHVTFSLSHYKRLINFVLALVTLDADTSHYRGQLNLKIPVSDYRFLIQFVRDVDNNENAALLRKIDQVMGRILIKSKLDNFTESLITWTDYIYFTFYNRSTAIITSCLFLLYISYQLLKVSFTIWSVVKYLIFIGWVTDFAFTWINLLQEADINKMADSLRYAAVPPHCDPNKMSWWQYLLYSISTDSECRQYHQTIYKDVFWSVAPLQIFSHQVGIMIYTPASYIGEAIGSMTRGILASLPWGVNIVVLPLLLIFALLIICILLSFMTETSFGLNMFHLIQFHFGNRERQAVGDMVTGRNLTALLDIAHRNMIEDVRPNNFTNSPKSENCNCRGVRSNEQKLAGENDATEKKETDISQATEKKETDISQCITNVIQENTTEENSEHVGSGDG